MGKGFYVSKLVGFVAIFFAIAAVATIIALSVVYANEKANNKVENGESTTATSSTTTSSNTTSTLKPTTPASTPSKEIWDSYRLPKTLIPVHYDVDLRPVLEKDSRGLYVFHGKSIAHFRCVTPTNLVIIHSNKLNYTESSIVLKDDANRSIPRDPYQIVPKTNYLVLHLGETLQTAKQYRLETEFTGELADDLAGFYRSEYIEDGVTKLIATTQMQAADARKAFPCFDEPGMKATFNITLRHLPSYVALSNMDIIHVTTETWNGQQWNVTAFHETPAMSTYLVAFIVSEFAYIGDDEVKIWGRRKAIEQGQGEYALNVTNPILKYFAEYYNVSYPLPKSDQVALPDFSAGAMENWGLVTYRDTALLWDPLESSISNKERVVTVIAHELAHQWFGNLVTIRWWNDLWLNEGFASYVEYLGADFAEPTWHIKDLSVLYDVHRVMAVDALANSHPLTSNENEVNTPAEISGLFDSITYSKGASVIRMLSSFLGEKLFVTGLASYLKAFAYGSTVYTDLWEHLQMAVDNQTNVTLPASVSAIMDTWTLQMGFPVVTIDTTTGSLNQKHFLLDPDSVVTRPSPFEYNWKVPVSFLKSDGQRGNIWLNTPLEIAEVFKIPSNEWILVNINATGYYRVNYDNKNWENLLNQLKNNHSVIPVINRAQIIDDAFNLARAKHVSTTRALDTTKFLFNEVEYMPWQAALNSLSYFGQMFDRSEVYGSMTTYMENQVRPLFNYFEKNTNNWTKRPETLTEQYNEINAISTACTYGIKECENLTVHEFNKWKDSGINEIHPNLRSTIYCNAIAQGGIQEWNFAWTQYNQTENAQEADKLRAALTCSKLPWILNRLLEYSVDGTIRKQDAISVISNVANNVIGQTISWDFTRANWKQLLDYFGGSMSFGNLISAVTRRFSNEQDLKQLTQFIEDNKAIGFGTAERALDQAIEKTKANIKWVNENKYIAKEWFDGAVKEP